MKSSVSVVRMVALVTAAFFGFASAGVAQDSPTTWESSDGNKLEAEFVRLTDDGVILKLKSNGKQAEVPFSRLSLKSHLQAIKLAKPEEFSKPVPKAEIAPTIDVPPPTQINLETVLQSPFSDSQTLEQFVEVFGSEMDQGNLFVAWHALPSKMQESLEDLIVAGMDKVGDGPIVQIKTLMGNLNTIVSEKKDFIFNNKTLMSNRRIKKQLYSVWPVIEQFVGSISREELWQKENFDKGNVERWLADFTSAIGSNLAALEKLTETMGGQPQPKFADVVSVPSSQETKGKVQLAAPMMPPQEVVFRKVRGQWIAPAWMTPMRAGIDAGLEQLKSVPEDQVRTGIQGALFTVIPPAGALARAKTQEEFDAVIDGLKPLLESIQGSIPPGAFSPGMGGPPNGNNAFAGGRGARGPGQGTGAGPGGNSGDPGSNSRMKKGPMTGGTGGVGF